MGQNVLVQIGGFSRTGIIVDRVATSIRVHLLRASPAEPGSSCWVRRASRGPHFGRPRHCCCRTLVPRSAVAAASKRSGAEGGHRCDVESSYPEDCCCCCEDFFVGLFFLGGQDGVICKQNFPRAPAVRYIGSSRQAPSPFAKYLLEISRYQAAYFLNNGEVLIEQTDMLWPWQEARGLHTSTLSSQLATGGQFSISSVSPPATLFVSVSV